MLDLYQLLAKPLLFRLDPELAHDLTIEVMKNIGPLIPRSNAHDRPELSKEISGMKFPNRLGLAAGLDKNAQALEAWQGLGFGFVEIGTVTYHPQPGNPRPRLWRLASESSLRNAMGFNNIGARAMRENILRQKDKLNIPLGINLGKSKIVDPDDKDAVVQDYLSSLELLGELADYLVVNVSSPNTPGLRQWEQPEQLAILLNPILERTNKPLFLKISPDQELSTIDQTIAICSELELAGLIATNTTVNHQYDKGGISGALLTERSLEVTQHIASNKPSSLAFISVGGIMSGADAAARLSAGADLVQIYTGLIYRGPGLVNEINQRT